MATALRPASSVAPSTRWSMYAGVYMFVCGTAMAFLLSDLLSLLGDVIGLPPGYAMFVLASPSLVIGAVVWWAVVERRDAYTYLRGGAFGSLTALLTGLLWVARFVSVWGTGMLAVGVVSILVAFVLGVAVVVGLVTGLLLMYARRRQHPEPASQNERPA